MNNLHSRVRQFTFIRSGFFIFFILAVVITSSRVQATKPSTLDSKLSLLAPLVINSTDIGMLWISPSENDLNFLIEAAPLSKIFKKSLNEKSFKIFAASVQKKEMISIAELKKQGLKVDFDEDMLNLNMEIPVLMLKKKAINIVKTIFHKPDSVSQSPFSGYLNTYLNQFYEYQEKDKDQDGKKFEWKALTSNFHLIANLHDFILDSGAHYSNSREKNWVRNDTRIIKDDKENIVRYMIGDLDYPISGFQTSLSGAGISATRNFSINPLVYTNPMASNEITIKRLSLVEIFINGNMIYKKEHPPGVVDISNFPFVDGLNEVFIRVTDESGDVYQINYKRLHHYNILKVGLSEFTFNLLAPSEIENFRTVYYPQQSFFSMFYRQGINKHLTLGMNLQGEDDKQMLGFEGSYLTNYGTINSNLATSYSKEFDLGLAAQFEYGSLERYGSEIYLTRLKASMEHRNSKFQQFGGIPIESTKINAYLSRILPKRFQGGVGVNFFKQTHREDRLSTNLSLSKQLLNSVQLGANYKYGFTGDREKAIFVFLNWYPSGSNFQSFNSYNSQTKTTSLQANHLKMGSGYRLHTLGGITSSPENKKGNIQVNYKGSRVHTQIDHVATRSDDKSLNRHDGHLSANFALAWAGSAVGIGGPISESFAIVEATPKPEEFDIPIGLGGINAKCKIGFFNSCVMSGLRAYMDNLIKLDIANIPIGNVIDQDAFYIHPSYQSGAQINITPVKFLAVTAILQTKKGRPVPLITGTLSDLTGKTVGELFSNRSGRIFIEKVKSGIYKIKLDNDIWSDTIINIPKDSTAPLVDLGVLVLNEKEEE